MIWHLSRRYGHMTLVSRYCFDTCQLTIIWMSIIRLCTCHRKPPPRGDVGHTWGFVSAYVTYQPPGGGGIVHFRQFIL